MNKTELAMLMTEKMKLIRTERGYTQEKMAEVLGISKKTLVQIEKGRTEAGWTTTVAACALFRTSDLLQNTLGGDPVELAEMAAHGTVRHPRTKRTFGGRVWWREVDSGNGYRLQQNLISGHYRILDEKDYRVFSTLDPEAAKAEMDEIRNVQQG